MRVYILDEHLQPVPAGAEGELCIAGVGVAPGYLNRPELSAERFREDPFGGGRLYRTGDIARVRPDGTIEHLGRADEQVKIRGFRIEPAEIEAALLAHPFVAEAAVAAREDREGRNHLVAYVVPARGKESVDPESLCERMSQLLPPYMIPSAFVILREMPRTASGKLDRHSMPTPDVFGVASGNGRRPRDPQEQALCALFTQVLGVAPVSIDDNFFYLGGDSLLAARLIDSVLSVMNADLNIRDLFDNPTVAGLAPVLRPSLGSGPTLRARTDGLPRFTLT